MTDPQAADGQELLDALRRKGLLPGDATLRPLTGGVSSEIYRVEAGDRQFVVKRALRKLKVAADWYADTSRNGIEQAFIRYVAAFRADAVPRLFAADSAEGFFCMEYLDGFSNLKLDLLEGRCAADLAHKAGLLLGEIHACSRGDGEAARIFDTSDNFNQLRVDPYLRATAAAHPALSPYIHVEADRLAGVRECLVHGDYSPKNFLHRDGRLVLLDCEVSWYGDGAFDLAFLLNHFLLKALFHGKARTMEFGAMIDAARIGYRDSNPDAANLIEERAARLLPMLLLARVDGKSPVEYLNREKQDKVRDFARVWIPEEGSDLTKLCHAWMAALNRDAS